MKEIAASELIINGDGSVFHLHLRPEEIADDIILVGDPGRVELVSSMFDTIELKRASREFVTATGVYNGKRVSVVSTGIGTDNIDIVVNELDALASIDLETRRIKEDKRHLRMLRLGTSGAIQPDIPLGSFVMSNISIGFDGLINWYAGRDGVALKDYEEAFVEHTGWIKELPAPYFVRSSAALIDLFKGDVIKGVTMSASGFYGPQGRVLRLPLAMPDMVSKFESFRFNGDKITNFEMESSALAGLAALLGHDASTICCIIANRHLHESQPDYKPYIVKLIKLALDRLTQTL